mmetsp:Transcript_66016/g.157847  ORF Transcript_66016/g.157847 Transcript_66016/m.157847 type:complete len:361 (-) Transcript_66016:47-1129(-)
MPDQTEDLYAILGVQRGAHADEIKKAYREGSLKHHPDKNADDPDAKIKFQRIADAFSVLSDAAKRLEYDKSRGFHREPAKRQATSGRSRSRSPKGNQAPQVRKPSKEVRLLKVGDVVQLEGLHAMPELNGSNGTIAHYDISACRWHVRLPSGDVKALRRENLVLVPSQGPAKAPQPTVAERKGAAAADSGAKKNGVSPAAPSGGKRVIKFVMAEEPQHRSSCVEIIDPKGNATTCDLSSDEEDRASPSQTKKSIPPPVKKAIIEEQPILIPVKPTSPVLAPQAPGCPPGNLTFTADGVEPRRQEKKRLVQEESKSILAKMTEQVKVCLERVQDPSLDPSSREKYQKMLRTLQASMAKVHK